MTITREGALWTSYSEIWHSLESLGVHHGLPSPLEAVGLSEVEIIELLVRIGLVLELTSL